VRHEASLLSGCKWPLVRIAAFKYQMWSEPLNASHSVTWTSTKP